MEEDKEFEGDNHLTKGISFSQLIQGDDIDDDDDVDHHAFRRSSVPSIQKTPEMLCFRNHGTDSSSASSCIHSLNAMFKSNYNKKRTTGSGAGSHKKSKAENSSGHAKRKEKPGERIAALQKLVSPFGKSDTASVLHVAIGCIRFLHDQVQAKAVEGEEEEEEEEKSTELKSIGLCLIPVECTINMAKANCNGADFWLPAMGNNINASWSSTTKKPSETDPKPNKIFNLI